MARIIDSVLVYDDGSDQSTELDQRMPVAAVGEPGGFDREYGSDAPLADRCQQTREARPSDAAARAAEIIIDDLDGGPAELLGMIGKPVLAPSALLVVHELIGRRLADVDDGPAPEMVSRDLGHRRPPRRGAAGLIVSSGLIRAFKGSLRDLQTPRRTVISRQPAQPFGGSGQGLPG